MRDKIPDGWVKTTLDSVALWSSGGTPSRAKLQFFNGTIPWLKTGELGDRFIYDAEEKITQEAIAASSAKIFSRGSVALAMYGATIGKASILGVDAATNQACAVGTPDTIDSLFLYYFLLSQRQAFIDAGKGGAQPNISQGIVKEWPLLLPPSAEQLRIVEKLEELLSDLDAGVAELKAAQKKLGQYRQSLLNSVVVGSLFGGMAGYKFRPLGDAIESIGQGWSPKCEHHASLDENDWAVIKTTAIQSLDFQDKHNKQLPLSLKPRPLLELKQGDLLVTRAGPRTRVGVTCLVKQTRKHLMLCDKAYRIRCKSDVMNPAFLELVLNAPQMVNELDTLKTGISDSGLNLTQDRFSALMIPYPTLEEQGRIVSKLEDALVILQQQETNINISLKQSAAQRKNILKSAFSGQLVPQDPNDEPASVLLERIRAGREAQAAHAKPERRKTKQEVSSD